MTDNYTGPKGIDWDSAFTFWASMPRTARTYVRVAEKYGVTEGAVRKAALRDDWVTRVAAIDRKAMSGVERRVTRKHEVRTAEALEIIDTLQQQLRKRVGAGDVVIDIDEFVSITKLAQLLAGEPTERIDVRQLQPVLVAFIGRIARLVPLERKAELDSELDWLEGEFSAIDAGDP